MTRTGVQCADAPLAQCIRGYIRSCPTIEPLDPVGQAVAYMGQWHVPIVPVTNSRGRLVGVLTQRKLAELLLAPDHQEAMNRPAADFVEKPDPILRSDASVPEARRALAQSPAGMAVVVDRGGHLQGIVWWVDLLEGLTIPTPVPNVGGMATPFGVYLVAGSVRAGVSQRSLLAAGCWLGLMLAAAYLATGVGCMVVDRMAGTRLAPIWYALGPPRGLGSAVTWLGLQAVGGALFVLLLRRSAIAAYHGAEHQVAHALERGHPLDYDVVARMPRVHPRCGTNIAAAAVLFGAAVLGLGAVLPGLLDAVWISMAAAAVTLVSWRRVGNWLQQHVTTRTPSREQLQAAIQVGETLRDLYLRTDHGQVSRLRWLWNSGAVHVAAGVAAGVGLPLIAADWLLQHLLR